MHASSAELSYGRLRVNSSFSSNLSGDLGGVFLGGDAFRGDETNPEFIDRHGAMLSEHLLHRALHGDGQFVQGNMLGHFLSTSKEIVFSPDVPLRFISPYYYELTDYG
jgi:hypothetical protein